jgi:hypothetical protein
MRFVFSCLLVCSLLTPTLRAAPPAALDHFEKKIRPVLVEQCYQCHSAEAAAKNKLRGGLSLDTRDGLLAGGDSGPALDKAKPADSLLLKSIRYHDDPKMPPKGKLPAEVIADFEKWVAAGAPDPRVGTGGPKKQIGMGVEEGRKFWAYVPPVAPRVPSVNATTWPANDIDRFTLAGMEAAGLSPSRDADRVTLARRLSFDLTGLPMPPDQVDAFVNDRAPNAYEKLVDRLLASPAFGERWGRHWLDTARYAESVTLRGIVFKEAWRYRDYVIDSFNRDVPLNSFIKEQLAGDLLPAKTPADRERQIVATTYLMLGNTNLEEQDKKQLRMDFVDEQLDVITKGLLGQTVTCARCHDHKFDPIPTKDYYALAGILRNVKTMEIANVSAWTEVPLPADPATEAKLKEKETKVAALQAKIKSAKALASKGGTAAKGALAVADVPGVVVDDAKAKKVGMWQDSTHSGVFVGAGYVHDQNLEKGQKTLTFAPALPADGRYEVRLAYSPGTNRATNVPVTVFGADGEKDIVVDMKKAPPLDGRFISLGTFKFEKAGQSFVIVSNENTNGHVTADCVTFVPVETTATADAGKKPKVAATPASDVAKLEAELKALQAAGPHRAMAMAPIEEKQIEETAIHVRGSVHTLGEPAPRGILTVAHRGPMPTFPKDQSGRMQLADWVASAENPLTSRVFVNRVWHWMFGAGLVRTVDNFGTTGEAPSHPELLDYLTTKFVAEGWSVKKLVREIALSHTYRQSSVAAANPAAVTKDPENRLFARANRRRLEAEAIRDTILVAAGTLDDARGGLTFPNTISADYGHVSTSLRRSVYLPQFRNALPELIDTFDPADVSTVTGKRNTSTVAPQALFLLNSPFVVAQSKHAAVRLLAEPDLYAEGRVERAYRLTLGRSPREGEKTVVMKYLADKGSDKADAWAALIHSLIASADFRYVE